MPVIENKNSNIKVGTVSAFPTNTIIPEGWLICNGAVLNKNGFPDLFSVIGYTYGGSGNSFNVPNLQGRFIRGLGSYDSDRSSGGIGATQVDQFQGHKHWIHTIPPDDYSGGWSGGGWFGDPFWGDADGNHMQYPTNYVNGNVRYGNETRPINMAMVFCIKY